MGIVDEVYLLDNTYDDTKVIIKLDINKNEIIGDIQKGTPKWVVRILRRILYDEKSTCDCNHSLKKYFKE